MNLHGQVHVNMGIILMLSMDVFAVRSGSDSVMTCYYTSECSIRDGGTCTSSQLGIYDPMATTSSSKFLMCLVCLSYSHEFCLLSIGENSKMQEHHGIASESNLIIKVLIYFDQIYSKNCFHFSKLLKILPFLKNSEKSFEMSPQGIS